MNSNQFGPFIVERARGGGYNVRNSETGSLNYQQTQKAARAAAHKSMIRRQDRIRSEIKGGN